MSRQLNNLRESRAHAVNLRDFTNSVDIKRFSRERGNMTPLHQPSGNFFKKIYERSNYQVRASLAGGGGVSVQAISAGRQTRRHERRVNRIASVSRLPPPLCRPPSGCAT